MVKSLRMHLCAVASILLMHSLFAVTALGTSTRSSIWVQLSTIIHCSNLFLGRYTPKIRKFAIISQKMLSCILSYLLWSSQPEMKISHYVYAWHDASDQTSDRWIVSCKHGF